MGLESVELIMDVEDAFRISIPDEQASLFLTVGDLHEYVCHALLYSDPKMRTGQCLQCGYSTRGLTTNRCPECGNTIPEPVAIERDEIWQQLVGIIVKSFGEKPSDIKPHTRFIEDLNFG